MVAGPIPMAVAEPTNHSAKNDLVMDIVDLQGSSCHSKQASAMLASAGVSLASPSQIKETDSQMQSKKQSPITVTAKKDLEADRLSPCGQIQSKRAAKILSKIKSQHGTDEQE